MSCEVSYIGDYAYHLPEDVFLAEKDADYVKACLALTASASKKTPLKIWVRKHYIYTWLQNFCEQTQLSCHFSEKTARLVLSDTWGVTVPDWLTDEDVVSLKLLDMAVKNEQPCRFAEALLGHFLGSVFRGDRLDRKRIAEILPALCRQETKELFEHYPLISKCLREQGQVWTLHAVQDWEKALIPLLISNPEDLWRDLSLWALLSGYPAKLLEYVVPLQQANFLRGIPVDVLMPIPLLPKGIEEATTQIEMFFKDIGHDVDSSTEFQKAVQCTSGRLLIEFRMVKSLLSAGHFAPTREDIVLVKDKFRQCLGLDAVELTTLDYMVMPERPLLPEKDSLNSPSAWASWVVNAYLPYRYWQTKKGHDDEELEGAVRSFSDWYIGNYETIHQNAETSLVHALGAFHDSIQAEKLSFVLLADGLPVTFWPMFEEALRKAGFHRHLLEYRFAPLPTDTEFVKPILVSGDWGTTQKSYEAILQERATNDWAGKKVVYLSSLKMLSDFIAPIEPAIVLLNLLASDEILHGDSETKGETHERELYRLFMRVGEMISAMLDRRQEQRETFGLYVLTDHGACYILDSEKQSFDSKIVSKLFTDEKRRFAMIGRDVADTVPENLWSLGYRFVPPFIKGENVFFIPRGHSTVRAGAGKGYTHGGATPEEVIVPVAFFKATKAAWKAPAARFLDLRIDTPTGKAVFYVQRLMSLRTEMLNPNVEDIRIVRVAILNPKTELKGQDLPVLTKGQATTVRLDCYFDKSALGQEELVLQFVYEIAGEERVMEMKLAAEFKSAVTGGSSLKDLKK
jgi:hypothetical protein